MDRGAVIIKLQRNADDVIARLLQHRRDDARIDAAGHGDDDARLGRAFAGNEREEFAGSGRVIHRNARRCETERSGAAASHAS